MRFSRNFNSFQKTLNLDIDMIKNSEEVWIRADKSKNIYKCDPSKYYKILKDKITDNYKKDRFNNRIFEIDNVTADLASNLNISDRMRKIHRKDAYILFKDHKPNFPNNTQSSLINPIKSELSVISKNIIKKNY